MRQIRRSWLLLAFGAIWGATWMGLPGPPAMAQISGAQGSAAQGSGEEIQMGISADIIPVTSDFGGTNLVVFGAIENPNRVAQALDRYSLVVVIRGAPKTVVVWRKQRVFGIWVNRQSRTYADVPSFYEVAASRPLDEIAPPDALKANGIGIANIPLNLFIRGASALIVPAPEFAAAIRDLRSRSGVYSQRDDSVDFLGSSLFRATVALPANIPIGTHEVTAYLFKGGNVLAKRTGSFEVRKHGFEDYLFRFAYDYAFVYGIVAVLIGVLTGWLASLAFGVARR